MKKLIYKLTLVLFFLTTNWMIVSAQSNPNPNPNPPITLQPKPGDNPKPRTPEFDNEVLCYVNSSSLTINFAVSEGNAQVYVYDINGALVGYICSSTYTPITVSHTGVAYSITVITDYGNEYVGYFN